MVTRDAEPEAPLIARARNGDPDAAEALVRRYFPLIRCIVLREQGIPQADADDIYQSVRIRFFQHVHRVEQPGAFLARTAVSLCLDYRRSRRAEAQAMHELAKVSPRGPARPDGLERMLVRRLDLRFVLGHVTKKCVDILTAVVLREATHEEYSAASRTPRGSIAPTMARCLRKVRTLFLARRGPQCPS